MRWNSPDKGPGCTVDGQDIPSKLLEEVHSGTNCSMMSTVVENDQFLLATGEFHLGDFLHVPQSIEAYNDSS
jgi:hypothetical protein